MAKLAKKSSGNEIKNRPDNEKKNKLPIIMMESCGCFWEGKRFRPCFAHKRDYFSKEELKLKYCIMKQRKMNLHTVFVTPKGAAIV